MVPDDVRDLILGSLREGDGGCLLWTGRVTAERSGATPILRIGHSAWSVRMEYFEMVNGFRARTIRSKCGERRCLSHLYCLDRPEREYRQEQRRRIERAYGKPRWVPVGPVIEHMTMLRDGGMSISRIADKAGVAKTAANNIFRGARMINGDYRPQENVYAFMAEAILGVQPDAVRPPGDWGSLVDVTGSSRRLRALILEGFPSKWIGERLGMEAKAVQGIVHGIRPLFAKNAEAVTALYAELDGADPSALGVGDSVRKRAVTQAVNSCFVPRHLWDEDTIDDPDGHPEYTGHCGTVTGQSIHKRDGIRVTELVDGERREFAACAACRKAVYAATVKTREQKEDPQ